MIPFLMTVKDTEYKAALMCEIEGDAIWVWFDCTMRLLYDEPSFENSLWEWSCYEEEDTVTIETDEYILRLVNLNAFYERLIIAVDASDPYYLPVRDAIDCTYEHLETVLERAISAGPDSVYCLDY